MTEQSLGTRRPSSAELLQEYRAGDFFFATSQHTVLGSGVADQCTDGDPARLSESVRARLRESPEALAVGALAFDTEEHPGGGGHVVIPARTQIAETATESVAALDRRAVGAPSSVVPVPAPGAHAANVSRAVRKLSERELRKVVLARALDLEFSERVSPEAILHNLIKDHCGSGYTFAVGLPQQRTLLGASPELLLRRKGNTVLSHPQAGTAPRSADPVQDAENARALSESHKDQQEHAVLTEAVVEGLRPFCRNVTVPDGPSIVSTPAVWHLGTAIQGELADPEVSALQLAAALHPTPAICGAPTRGARDLIAELEPFDRGYYAGTVGWMDAAGDGEWAVALRCAEVAERGMRLYAGGGIMRESEAESELAETSAKFQILLRAMGLDLEL